MPGNPLTDPNWAANIADTVERVVGTIRTTATDRIVVAVRWLVLGVIVAITAVAAIVLSIILGTKLIEVVVGRVFRQDQATSVWIAYFVSGGLLILAGAVAMRLRHTKATS